IPSSSCRRRSGRCSPRTRSPPWCEPTATSCCTARGRPAPRCSGRSSRACWRSRSAPVSSRPRAASSRTWCDAMVTVQAENLGKAYRRYARPFDRAREWLFGGHRHDEFWALRELDLTVAAGEAVGVIGDNGAGKSTLLALLTGTTRPTTGRVAVRGRLAAIL